MTRPTARRFASTILVMAAICVASILWAQPTGVLEGRILDPQERVLPDASVQLFRSDLNGKNERIGEARSGSDGSFQIRIESEGHFLIKVDASGFRSVTRSIIVRSLDNSHIEITLSEITSRIENVTVTADVNESNVLSPDPGERVFVRQDLLDANPGRPGAPVSIPGYPIETASSGIKAPQYFAPGVAGDHGEPIAQYIAVGSYILPNNLSANAHGNGYSDPNMLIPEILESAEINGGAFNVRQGNHAVNLAGIYGLRSRLDPFVTVTGDYRDSDLVTGFSPTPDSFVAFGVSYGNGFLKRLEHRKQYKFNGERVFHVAQHGLTLLALGYYGSSYIPGLVPLFSTTDDPNSRNHDDTIDPRQKDQTHSALVALNDVWQVTGGQQLQLSGFFRTYNLSLFSDFGQGLIRQSEFRTVTGGSVNYINKLTDYFSLLGGLDYQRDAPRQDNLDHYGVFDSTRPNYYEPATAVASNNLTIAPVSPYVAAEGA
jgi:Carboxypeptidase regulatory-like domain